MAKKRHVSAILLGLLIALIAGFLSTSGIFWSEFFHPDETTIAEWINQVIDEGYIKSRAYPSGWFELYRIRCWAQNQSLNASRHWRTHSVQDGKVKAINAHSFLRTTELPADKKEEHTIQDGRLFNAWLHVFAALFLFAACLETGQRPLAAFLSSLFFLASAAPMEFLHYCETDEALVVSLACCTWMAARALRKKSPLLSLATGGVAGFAISCKFTLFPLLLLCATLPVVVLYDSKRFSRRKALRCGALALGMLAMAAAGYLLGTPALRLAPEWYFSALRKASEGTYAEILMNLGGVYSAWGANAHRLVFLGHALADIGLLTLIWSAFAWTFWFKREFRRQIFGVPFLLPLFFPFFVFCCPFVRRQETLPLSILFAIGSGLPLEWIARNGRQVLASGRSRQIACLAAGVVGLLALASGAMRTGGMASCFMLRDSRAEAQNWLHDSVQLEEPVAFDAYVGQLARGVPCQAIEMGGLPYLWDGGPFPQTNGVVPRYYFENIGFTGRLPIRDLRTGLIRKDVRTRLANYQASVFPLRQWSVAKKALTPTFGQPRLRLVSFDRPSSNAVEIPIGYSRPIRLLSKGAHLYDSGGVDGLGAVRAVRTVGRRIPIHVNFDNAPCWLVTRMLAGDAPARIMRESLFVPRRSTIGPNGTTVAALEPTLLENLGARAMAFSTSKCRMRGNDQTLLCGTFLTHNVASAARELRSGGNPAGALALLKEAGPLDAEAKVEAFLAAAEAHEPPLPEWTDAARSALSASESLAMAGNDVERSSWTLCGVPVGILSDFARLRMRSCLLASGQVLPVFLPAGQYDVSLDLSPQFSIQQIPPRVFKSQVTDFRPIRDASGKVRLQAALNVRAGQMLGVMGPQVDRTKNAALMFTPFTAEVEVSWSPIGQTLAAAEHLRQALQASQKLPISKPHSSQKPPTGTSDAGL